MGFPPQNGFYDNSIPGVTALNTFAAQPSSEVFYFTMSFDATGQFPNETLYPADLATFPFSNFMTNPFNIWGSLITMTMGAAQALETALPGIPMIVKVTQWAVKVANTHLRGLGYFSRIPTPGPVVPRSDILPSLSVTCYAMGGFEIPGNLAPTGLAPDLNSEDFQPNDGVVNTVSMRGPDDAYVTDVASFPVQALGSVASVATTRGMYWHLGINKTMDHGDEIGVFTVGKSVR